MYFFQSFRQFRFAWLLVLLTFVSCSLLAATMLLNRNLDFWYMPYNLVLGFIPVMLAGWLVQLLKHRTWLSWLPVAVTLLWLLFLPNSFYLVTDFIHLIDAPRADILLDVIMLTAFSITGLLFGCLSLYIVHRAYLRQANHRWAWPLVALLIAACSFAIYIGRHLRWNSWDIIVQPGRVVADVLHQLSLPFGYVPLLTTTLGFFVLIASVYLFGWELGRGAGAAHKTSK